MIAGKRAGGSEDSLDEADENREDVPLISRLLPWIMRRFPRSRAFWVTLPASFALIVFLGYTERIGLFRNPYISVWMLNPIIWWPYFLTGNHFIACCVKATGLHRWLISHPFEYALSIFWWLVVSVAIARIVSTAWSRRARFKAWVRSNTGILATFFAVLWIVSVLAHVPGIGYTQDDCPLACADCRGISLVSLNWVFWWPFHAVGLGCFCGRGPPTYPHLYVASFLWWLSLSWFLARLTLPGLREFREKPPLMFRRRRRIAPRQKV
ncbi:MAG: hypothetical protein KAW39_04170 [Thermoplasmata archaeon]|nr:hypothetical protein [Thermoplasmata archaeon]